MYFVFYAPTNKELCEADAIACQYIESKMRNLNTLAAWNARSFVINSPTAKRSEFWLSNKERLDEAIAAEKWECKTLDQLTPQDYQAKNSLENLASKRYGHRITCGYKA
jgi:hypothetical protein